MSEYLKVLKKELKPHIESLADDMRARRDPNFFWPTGTQVYVGRQGSGKTISAVKHVLDLKARYPKCIIVSNLSLTGIAAKPFSTEGGLKMALEEINPQKEYIQFQNMEELGFALVGVNNGKFGVIYLIDEIHTYFNALDSKNIPMFVFTEISQQRKQRKVIIGTSQLFLRMAKPFREQCDNLIMCSTHFGVITIQKAYDGMSLEQDYDGKLVGTVKKTGLFIQNRKIRSSYDTYQKVISGAEQYENNTPLTFTLKTKNKKVAVKSL
jgi:hypothetical protein